MDNTGGPSAAGDALAGTRIGGDDGLAAREPPEVAAACACFALGYEVEPPGVGAADLLGAQMMHGCAGAPRASESGGANVSASMSFISLESDGVAASNTDGGSATQSRGVDLLLDRPAPLLSLQLEFPKPPDSTAALLRRLDAEHGEALREPSLGEGTAELC